MSDCNIDDILCQIGTLNKMKNLHERLQDDDFKKEFLPTNQPLFKELSEKLAQTIEEKEALVRTSLGECNLPPMESEELPGIGDETWLEE